MESLLITSERTARKTPRPLEVASAKAVDDGDEKTKKRKLDVTDKVDAEVESEDKDEGSECLELFDKLKLAIVALIPLWKDEWKILVYQFLNQMRLRGEHDQGKIVYSLTFSKVPDLTLFLKPKEDEVRFQSFHSGNLENAAFRDVQIRMRSSLSMNKIPFNLWFSLLRQIRVTFCISPQDHSCRPSNVFDEIGRPYFENQVYVRPQHYHPKYFNYSIVSFPHFVAGEWCGIYLDRWTVNGCLDSDPAFLPNRGSAEFVTTVAPLQIDEMITLVFHYSIAKQTFARKIAASLHVFERAGGGVVYYSDMTGHQQDINWLQNGDGEQVPLCELFFANQFNALLLDAKDCFSEHELGLLFAWVHHCHCENSKLVKQCFSDPTFPTIDDHFDNPKLLRGRLADTSILKTTMQFREVLAALPALFTSIVKSKSKSELSGGSSESQPQPLLPLALMKLIVDYFPFPPPPLPSPSPL